VSEIDNNETSGNKCSMDATIDYGEEVARQWQGRLRSMAAAEEGV
jgi:hypothetical protein